MIHLEAEGAMAAQKIKCASKNFSDIACFGFQKITFKGGPTERKVFQEM